MGEHLLKRRRPVPRCASSEGAGDPLDKAEIETAESILEKALALNRAVGDAHLEGRTLIQMARTMGYVNPGAPG